MHTALFLRDILDRIFEQLSFHGERRTLAALARTCMTFKEPALDAVWAILWDLMPLIKCLPRDAWELESRDGIQFLVLKRPLKGPEWETLRGYARRVREITGISGYGACQLDDKVIRALCYPPSIWTERLFPKLRTITWDRFPPEILPFLRELAGPAVTTITMDIQNPWTVVEQSILFSLKNLCPHVEHASFYLYDQDFDESFTELLCSWSKLRSIACYPISETALLHLSRTSSVHTLQFKLQQPDLRINWGTLACPSSIPNLEMLHLSCHSLQMIDELVQSIRRSPKEIHAITEERPSPLIWDFFSTIQATCSQDRLHKISLERGSTFDRSHVFTCFLEDFAPLLSFHKLIHVVIETGCDVDLSDSDMLTLASSWPNVQYLAINLALGWGTAGITLPCLVCLLKTCGSLQFLAIRIDTSNYTTIPENRDGYTSAISTIHVLDSAIMFAQVTPLAALFSDVCPNVRIETGIEQFVVLWGQVSILSREIAKVRRQERRWYRVLYDTEDDNSMA